MNTLVAIPNVSCSEPTYCTTTTPPGCPCYLPGAAAAPAPVPTLSPWAIVIVAVLLAIAGLRWLR